VTRHSPDNRRGPQEEVRWGTMQIETPRTGANYLYLFLYLQSPAPVFRSIRRGSSRRTRPPPAPSRSPSPSPCHRVSAFWRHLFIHNFRFSSSCCFSSVFFCFPRKLTNLRSLTFTLRDFQKLRWWESACKLEKYQTQSR